MVVVKKRKPKTSDRDIKKFFRSYHDAKGRRKVLLINSIGRNMTEEEQQEYKHLELFIQLVEEIVDTLEPLQSKVVRAFYIENKSLFSISLDVNFCYEHVSWVKVSAGNNIRNLLSGANIISGELALTLEQLIIKTREAAEQK